MKKKRVVIGLSGGVDSAVAAYLLKKEYDVTAVFMRNWDDFFEDKKEVKTCTQSEDWKDAKKVAEQLDIPIFKIEFINEYWDNVFIKFIKKLEIGQTPNPDILCNKIIKFQYFIEYVKKNFSADFIATGHYAKIIKNKENYYLARPKDVNKDQTYFLLSINKNVLKDMFFPLANMTKKEVRELAEKIELVNYKKRDSTGICFVGERKFDKFIFNFISRKNGEIIDIETNEIVGAHSGHFLFTIGQRKKLNIQKKTNRYYVIGKDSKKNIVFVAKYWNNEWLYSRYCVVEEINWLIKNEELNIILSSKNSKITAKFRYRQPEIIVKKIILDNSLKKARIEMIEGQRALTPGQYAFFLNNEICLGGGIISQTEKINKFGEPIQKKCKN